MPKSERCLSSGLRYRGITSIVTNLVFCQNHGMYLRILTTFFALVVFGAFAPQPAKAQQDVRVAVRMAQYPSLSPDGKRMVFDWKGDVWLANSAGSRPVRLTRSPPKGEYDNVINGTDLKPSPLVDRNRRLENQ